VRPSSPETEFSRAAQLVEAWLAEQISATSSPGSPYGQDRLPILAPQTVSERLATLRIVLAERPNLAGATRRLSVYDQLRLSVALLHDAVSPVHGTGSLSVARNPSLLGTARRPTLAAQSTARCHTTTPGASRARNGR
jgi:hypothetical protein